MFIIRPVRRCSRLFVFLPQLTSTSYSSTSTVAQPVDATKPRAEGDTRIAFVDFRRVRIKAGNGGDGLVSFLRAKREPFCGPDGGDGGNGGHVVFQADTSVRSLSSLLPHCRAKNGNQGGQASCHGANAEHTILKVPLGTRLTRKTASEEAKIIFTFTKDEQVYIAARGGCGGRGNQYYVSSTATTPLHAQRGGNGEEFIYDVEMRVLAHAGLVGFPNAGKSTLLRAISRARPKVAAYPFTTLNPHIGMVNYDDLEQLAVADIPGLVSGAHKNEGLGYSFLRHIERCLCLFYVIDMSLPDPWQQLQELKTELEFYEPGLSERPHAIVANKMDLQVSEPNLELFRQRVPLPVYPVSAKEGPGVRELLVHFREIYEQNKIEWYGIDGKSIKV